MNENKYNLILGHRIIICLTCSLSLEYLNVTLKINVKDLCKSQLILTSTFLSFFFFLAAKLLVEPSVFLLVFLRPVLKPLCLAKSFSSLETIFKKSYVAFCRRRLLCKKSTWLFIFVLKEYGYSSLS